MQSFRKQTHPKNTLIPEAPDSVRRVSYSPQPPADSETYNTLRTRSASFNPISDKDKMESFQVSMNAYIYSGLRYFLSKLHIYLKYKNLLFLFLIHQGEQDQLLCLVSQTQRGRMDEQRCSINPLSPSPRHMENSQSGQSVIIKFNQVNNSTNALKSQPIREGSLLSACLYTPSKQSKMSRIFLNSFLTPKIDGSMISG